MTTLLQHIPPSPITCSVPSMITTCLHILLELCRERGRKTSRSPCCRGELKVCDLDCPGRKVSTVASLWLTSVAGEGTGEEGEGTGEEEREQGRRGGDRRGGGGDSRGGEGTGGRGEGQTKTRVIVKHDNACISHT